MCKVAFHLAWLVGITRARTIPQELANGHAYPVRFTEVDAESPSKTDKMLATILLALGSQPASGVEVKRGHASASRVAKGPQMFNLFGNTEESKKRRNDLALRDAPDGSNMLTFEKPNRAVSDIGLGIKFREGANKEIYVGKIIPGTQADDYKKEGVLSEGDEIVMVSATFGDEMWSSRGIGIARLESSIKIRSGKFVSLVFEGQTKNSGARQKALQKAREQEEKRVARLQKLLKKEMQEEAEAKEEEGGFKFPWQ
jgi:hypothetical protein